MSKSLQVGRGALIGGGFVVAGAVAASIAFATNNDGPVPADPEPASDVRAFDQSRPATSAAEGVHPDVLKEFAIFRREARSSDRLAGDEFSAQRGANFGLARLAQRHEDGHEIFLVPAEGGICFSSSGFVEAGCISNEDALSGKNAQSIVCAPRLNSNVVEFYGVLPDSAKEPEVLFEDGSRRPLEVSGNVFAHRSDRQEARPVAIEFTLNGERTTTSTNVPADAAKERCAS